MLGFCSLSAIKYIRENGHAPPSRHHAHTSLSTHGHFPRQTCCTSLVLRRLALVTFLTPSALHCGTRLSLAHCISRHMVFNSVQREYKETVKKSLTMVNNTIGVTVRSLISHTALLQTLTHNTNSTVNPRKRGCFGGRFHSARPRATRRLNPSRTVVQQQAMW